MTPVLIGEASNLDLTLRRYVEGAQVILTGTCGDIKGDLLTVSGSLDCYFEDTSIYPFMFERQDKYHVVGANPDEPLPGYHATYCAQCGRQHDVAFCVRSSRSKNFKYKGHKK